VSYAKMRCTRYKEGSDSDELYLLGTEESFCRLGQIISSTDQLAQSFIQAMSVGTLLQTQGCMSFF
jgi:hypothetical protein